MILLFERRPSWLFSCCVNGTPSGFAPTSLRRRSFAPRVTLETKNKEDLIWRFVTPKPLFCRLVPRQAGEMQLFILDTAPLNLIVFWKSQAPTLNRLCSPSMPMHVLQHGNVGTANVGRTLLVASVEDALELVRKLFKKIGQDIAADPELAPDLIEPFKSKGIGEDGTLIIKASSTAKPGKQSMIRRAALRAAQNAFRENGIKAGPKP
jgi:hypothetical protein